METCKIYEVPGADRGRTAGAVRCHRRATDHLIIDGRIVPICDRHADGFELWADEIWVYAAGVVEPGG